MHVGDMWTAQHLKCNLTHRPDICTKIMLLSSFDFRGQFLVEIESLGYGSVLLEVICKTKVSKLVHFIKFFATRAHRNCIHGDVSMEYAPIMHGLQFKNQ
jgi:hypothetical protein